MIKAIAFDMDGVLIEAKDWHFQALNRALALFGCQISRSEHLTTFDGLPTRRKLQMLSADNKIPMDLHDFINEMKQHYTMEIVAAQCKPRFTHEYALSRLHAQGYKLAVCSNSIRSTIEVMMARAALDLIWPSPFPTRTCRGPSPIRRCTRRRSRGSGWMRMSA